MTDTAAVLVICVGVSLSFLGAALWDDAKTGRPGAVVGGVLILLGIACALGGVWALSGGAA